MLTGDKLETAINIGLACNLLESSMERKGNLLRLDAVEADALMTQLSACEKRLEEVKRLPDHETQHPVGLVLTSQALAVITAAQPDVVNRYAVFVFVIVFVSVYTCAHFFCLFVTCSFLAVACYCKAVVGCRMQPNQKARVVQLVKEYAKVITLAIGDGANDEQMIREADVGVGIRGVEGTTAVRAADYAISQFQYLRRLLLVHGTCGCLSLCGCVCLLWAYVMCCMFVCCRSPELPPYQHSDLLHLLQNQFGVFPHFLVRSVQRLLRRTALP